MHSRTFALLRSHWMSRPCVMTPSWWPSASKPSWVRNNPALSKAVPASGTSCRDLRGHSKWALMGGICTQLVREEAQLRGYCWQEYTCLWRELSLSRLWYAVPPTKGGTTNGQYTVHRCAGSPLRIPGFDQPDARRVLAAGPALRGRVPGASRNVAPRWETAE